MLNKAVVFFRFFLRAAGAARAQLTQPSIFFVSLPCQPLNNASKLTVDTYLDGIYSSRGEVA
jgi:hypothetical protein